MSDSSAGALAKVAVSAELISRTLVQYAEDSARYIA